VRKASLPLPAPVLESLAALGAGLKTLRLRRGLPTGYAAERVSISRGTLRKIERGDPGVAIGSYARLLAGYGLLDRLERIANPPWSREETALERSRLPQRIRSAPEGW
jgi:transcriptional regulator with XRE-family HTH domain